MNGRHATPDELQSFIEGSLSPDEKEKTAAHLELCPGCASRYRFLRALDGAVRNLPLADAGPGFTDAVMAKLDLSLPPSRAFRIVTWLAYQAGLLVVAWAMTKLALRLLCGVLGVGAFLVALHLLCYRLEATDAGLVSQGVLGSTAIGWKDVREVRQGGDGILINGPGNTSIAVDTTDFEPEERASLERTISRRVRETAGPVVEPAAKAP